MDASSMESTVTLRQTYMVMFEFLRREWRRRDKPDALGALLGNLAYGTTQMGTERRSTRLYFRHGWNAQTTSWSTNAGARAMQGPT